MPGGRGLLDEARRDGASKPPSSRGPGDHAAAPTATSDDHDADGDQRVRRLMPSRPATSQSGHGRRWYPRSRRRRADRRRRVGAAAVRRPAANSASMTRRLATASSGSTGSGAPSSTAVGEASASHGVRVGRVEGQGLGRGRDRRVAAGGHEHPRRAVGRDVERDLDRDPALRPVDVDPLVGLGPRRAGEGRDARRRTRGRRWSGRRRPRAGSRRMAAWTRRARRRTASATG